MEVSLTVWTEAKREMRHAATCACRDMLLLPWRQASGPSPHEYMYVRLAHFLNGSASCTDSDCNIPKAQHHEKAAPQERSTTRTQHLQESSTYNKAAPTRKHHL